MTDFDWRQWMVFVCCLGAGGCLATPENVVIHRASREFSCPSEKVALIQRADISASLYDVAACGQRARYACVNPAVDDMLAEVQCIREPDPNRWDPDPTLIASLPVSPTGGTAEPIGGNIRRICGEDASTTCLYRDNGSWRWREARRSSSCGGMSCP